MVDINKNARIDHCKSIIYGDEINQVILSKHDDIHGDVQRWHELTSASRTNSVTKLSFPKLALHERLGQTRAMEKKELHHVKKLKVGGEEYESEDCIIANRERWEETTSQGENHHLQFNIQKERVKNNSFQMDQNNEHRLQNNQDLEDSNILEIDMWHKNHQETHELDVDLERSKEIRDHLIYGECPKKQNYVNCRMTSIDGCREFLSSGKDGKLAFTCATCGYHRNFHQHIVLFEDEEQQELMNTKNEKEEQGGNFFTPTCDIDRVSHELINVANSAIALAQDSLCCSERRNQELSIEEQNIIAKISLENLNHITKVINSTTECLTLLRKPPPTIQKDIASDQCPHEGPSSSDASPVITVEKRATQQQQPLLTTPTTTMPTAACPFGGSGLAVKNSTALFPSDACGRVNNNNNSGSAPRKPAERSSLKLKRTRTRISLEQREKLNAFAEKAGWTVVGQRKETIEAACQYIGIEPKTLKYWIHNSKQKWKRQPGQPDDMRGK